MPLALTAALVAVKVRSPSDSEREPKPTAVAPSTASAPSPRSVAEPTGGLKLEPRLLRTRPRRVRVERSAPRPVSVSVPSVGISAPVIPLGLRRNGSLEVPRDYSEAGWRKGGPEPGERGAALIAGHVDSRRGPAAFYRLRQVGRGSVIKVRRADGSTVSFVAQRTERVSKDGFPTRRVYGATRLPTLRLVTCDGRFDTASGHYSDNLIVYATRAAS